MKKFQLGEFEEIVLLTVSILENGYGVSIRKDIEDRLSRTVSMGALQTALKRMEDKGYVKSILGEATAERGGKRKRYFTITAYGIKALTHTMKVRLQLWQAAPGLSLEL
ncbi:MAG: helix-turn-helix transcriptional regulator [Cyclobacteriaceae bacterium]